MATPPARKLYLGPRLRMLRRELGISQTQMADEIGVSPSYLNHLERNQRPLTAQMLVRLANSYDIDMRDFVSGAASADGGAALFEILDDPLVREAGVTRGELLELAENYPSVAEALTRFHGALALFRRTPDVDRIAAADTISTPVDWLGGYLVARRNHFAGLESAAEALGANLADDPAVRAGELRVLLRERFGITVMVMPAASLGETLRHYDFHRRRLMLSERLPATSRAFALAYQLAASAFADAIQEQVARAEPPDGQAQSLLKIALTNYGAAALLMPYARFHAAAEESRYDLDLLCGRFGVSYEQAAHRLTTLDRSGARGIPFFMLRVDRAGNLSKRLTGGEGGDAAARAAEGCPRWGVHEARADRTGGYWIEMPDGQRLLTLIRQVASPGIAREGGPLVVILGCDARHAARTAFDPGKRAPDIRGVGPGCRLCERAHCPDRAAPPVMRALDMSSIQRAASPYPFREL